MAKKTAAVEAVPINILTAKQLPGELSKKLPALKKALGGPVPVDLKEDYHAALQPATIAHILIPVFHDTLKNAAIAYVYRKEWKKEGRVMLAKIRALGGIYQHLTECDFVMEINHTAWVQHPDRVKVALIDHELQHAYVDLDNAANKVGPHDVEEFIPIISRWGLWQDDLRRMGAEIQQLKLL